MFKYWPPSPPTHADGAVSVSRTPPFRKQRLMSKIVIFNFTHPDRLFEKMPTQEKVITVFALISAHVPISAPQPVFELNLQGPK